MEELKLIKEYLEERIRIDSLPEGFAKAYDEATVKHQNIKILGLLSNLERAYGNKPNSKPANCAVFDVSKALIAFFKWRKGQQLTADTVLEIETFAKEYESNL